MKLYEFAPAPNARRVSLFLAEKGIEIERVPVDVRGGANLTDAFRAMSANGKIPLLELDDGSYLCESVAICRYLDETFPSTPSLFGDTPLARARIEMWHRIVELDGLLPAFQAFRNISGVYQDREHCVPEWGEESRRRVRQFLPRLEHRLSRSPYVAGEQYSVADIAAYVLADFCVQRLSITLDEYPYLQAWLARIEARPALRRPG
ncbi:glutathione S-transferase family protein [Zobellella taiwanensis]|jgi:glutathione S-transferase|uniref:Glutathione S-transferase n=1 Tax=Zobellella taiwanensis TaxID=347535 RepID=A0A2P7R6X0_9GAMM|nr:glutathione S-transferase family protein [Zobellella taiwanensis]PSJ45950.1 glutathione S-transferase [Zobellella taiwanensis]